MLASILQFLTRPATLLVIGIVALVYIGFSMAFRWTDEKMVAHHQEELFDRLSSKKWDRAGKLLSNQYRDQWNFSRADATLALKDVGRQFLSLHLTPADPFIEIPSSKNATYTTSINIQGHGSPIAGQVIAEAHRLKEPFTFTWQKEGWHPWSWRLTQIANPGLPDDLYGYQPGDLTRAINEGARELGLEPLPEL
ncbi:MAG: hypothetical protein AAF591_14695 [Verrucomicrobiota bacterium]